MDGLEDDHYLKNSWYLRHVFQQSLPSFLLANSFRHSCQTHLQKAVLVESNLHHDFAASIHVHLAHPIAPALNAADDAPAPEAADTADAAAADAADSPDAADADAAAAADAPVAPDAAAADAPDTADAADADAAAAAAADADVHSAAAISDVPDS